MRRVFPRSLRGQLLLVTLTALVLAQGLSFWLFADERDLAVQAAMGQEAAGRAANVAILLEKASPREMPSILQAASSPLVRFSLGDTPVVDHTVHDRLGISSMIARQLAKQPGSDVRVEVHQRSRANTDVPDFAGMPDMSERMQSMHMDMRTMPISASEMRISIHLKTGDWLNVESSSLKPPLQAARATIATFFVTAALITMALWFALARLTTPLRRLAEAADKFGRGEPPDPVEITGPEEMQRLALTFNEMQQRIRRFVDDRTRLLAALGHDLRSPLTALRVRAEMVDDDETRERMVATIEEMQQMVEGTLEFARGMAMHEPATLVDLGEFTGTLCAEMAETGEPVAFLSPDRTIPTKIRPSSTRRALRNLIENAVRYGHRAQVTASLGEGAGIILIEDEGSGIAQEDMQKVFEPFVRLENSRSRETGGTGLGLSIARGILQAQGGDISLENRSEGGLRVVVSLPLAQSDDG